MNTTHLRFQQHYYKITLFKTEFFFRQININSFLHLSLNITHYALKTNIGSDTTSFIYEWHMLIRKKQYFKYLAFHVTLSVQFVKQLKGVSFPIGLQVVACTKVSEGIVGYIFCCPEYMYIHLACTLNFVRATCVQC